MKNYTLTCGLILGFLGIIITGTTYFIGIGAMTSLWTSFCRTLSLFRIPLPKDERGVPGL